MRATGVWFGNTALVWPDQPTNNAPKNADISFFMLILYYDPLHCIEALIHSNNNDIDIKLMNPWLFTIMFTSQLLDIKATTCRTSWCQDWWWYRDIICGNQSQPGYGGRNTQKCGDNQWTMDISCSCGHLFPLVLTLAVISAAEIKTPVNHQVELASFGRNSQNSSIQTGISHSTPPKMCSTGTKLF